SCARASASYSGSGASGPSRRLGRPRACLRRHRRLPLSFRQPFPGERTMKIAKVEQFYPRPRTRLVKITTDNGIVGWGESTLEGKARSGMAAVEEIGDYLIGKDPLRIEHHWQHVYRSAFFRGGAILMSALSGVDQALWDIAGKHFGAPVHQLLGGATRDRIRV